MKKINLVLILVFATIISCEKDDLCSEDTSTTPRLIIEFYDISNQESSKNVFSFRAQGIGNENALEDYNIITTNDVFLPLKTSETVTQYKLHKNYNVDDNGTPDDETDDIIGGNEDIITIAYDTEEVYVSRACGYKTIFKNITIDVEDDGNQWILLTQTVNDNQSVENETEAHFKFFH